MNGQSFIKTFPGNRQFIVAAKDILAAPVDAIVNPANSGLSHGGGLAAIIASEAGSTLEDECDSIIERQGQVPVGKAVVTNAGRLPFKGIIHAVGPRMNSGNELKMIARTVIYSLKLAERKRWAAIAFPAISTGIFNVPVEICAKAFKKAIPLYWEKYQDSSVKTVWLCLMPDDFPLFEKILKD